jgi:hypothetical protein
MRLHRRPSGCGPLWPTTPHAMEPTPSAGAYISIPRAVVAHLARGLRAPVWPPYSRSIANLQHWLLVDALRFLREASVPLFAHTFSSLSATWGPMTKASVWQGRPACRYLTARQVRSRRCSVYDGPSRTPTPPFQLNLLLACMPLLTRFRPRRPAVFRSGIETRASGQSPYPEDSLTCRACGFRPARDRLELWHPESCLSLLSSPL